jgi:hypothetical protein
MAASNTLSWRQSQHLLWLGIARILFALFEGLVIPSAASPRIALSVHMLSGFQGVFMLRLACYGRDSHSASLRRGLPSRFSSMAQLPSWRRT